MIKSKIEVKSFFHKNIDAKLALILLCKKHYNYSSNIDSEWSIHILNVSEHRLICNCDSKKEARKLFSHLYERNTLSLEDNDFLGFFPTDGEDEDDNPTYLNNWSIPISNN